MTAIRHLIANPEEVWEFKDKLRSESLLQMDFLGLYKGKFVEYMKAKAEALYSDFLKTHEEPVALHLTELQMKRIAEAWKQAAKLARRIPA